VLAASVVPSECPIVRTVDRNFRQALWSSTGDRSCAMNIVTRTLVASVDWAALRTDSGSGTGLVRAFEDLSTAASEESSRNAYWRIDNEVIVQGELYEAAVPALEVLLSMAPTAPPGPVRRSLAELVQQITFGQPRGSEIELGNTDLATRCLALASEATWIFYGWLTDDDSDVRECALLTLQKVDSNEARKGIVFAACRAADSTPGVQRSLSEIERGLL